MSTDIIFPRQVFDAPPTRADISSGINLARAFGWVGEDTQLRDIRQGGTHLNIARCMIGGESEAVFATTASRNGHDPLDSAALYAYHSTTNWGILADEDGLTVFNSHWLLDGSWFNLPKVYWENLNENTDLIQALTPRGLVDGELERLASRRCDPSSFLQPVDDELVERLDGWRDQALRYATSAQGVDARLQVLYAQLFVLRTVEDRSLEPNVPPLSSIVLGSEDINYEAWESLFKAAQRQIGSDLFDEDVTPSIPSHVVAGVINDLYKPRGLPGIQARYDFSWIEADVLGLAYEKYLATVLQPTPNAPQMEMFFVPERNVERLTVRRRSGAYYTPRFISGYLATRCIDDYFSVNGKDASPPRVIDFACGSGSFLVAAVNQILKHLKTRDPDRKWAKELIVDGYIAGVDVDEKAVTAARLHLWQRLIQEPGALPLPKLSNAIVKADGLMRHTWGPLNHQYDVILGNPPFLATSLVQDRAALESQYKTAKGRYDFSYLFVEQAINLLAEGGLLGLVVPNRLLRNSNGTTIRELLIEKTSLRSIVDFGSTRPFDASAYVGCIVAQRRRLLSKPPEHVRVLEVQSLDPEFLTALLLAATTVSADIDLGAIRSYSARHPTSGSPWLLLSAGEQRALVVIEDSSVRLDTIAAVPQGIRTGGNDLFIFTVESGDRSHLCKATNGLGETTTLELELLEPVVYGSEVRRYQIVAGERRLLYPYRRNNVLSEVEIEAQYPNTWLYLRRNRDLLASRASLTKSGGKWYELVWPRDETWLRKPKLLIRDLAPRTAFSVDQRGATFLVGGTAVVPEQADMLLPLLAYLNSSVVDGLVRRTTPHFRGNFQKFEPRHIQAVPVLNRILEDDMFAAQLASLAMEVVGAQLKDEVSRAQHYEDEINKIVEEAARQSGVQLVH